jgi:hypothetical protein
MTVLWTECVTFVAGAERRGSRSYSRAGECVDEAELNVDL